MSVNSVYQRIRATGNGSQVEFSFPWKFIENQDLKVYVNDELKEIDSDYSIVANDKKTSGKIAFNIAPVAGSIIVIKRDGDRQQDKLYNLRNAFDPNNVEYSFDKLTLLVQELADGLRQTLISESQSGVDWLIDKLDNENGILYVDLENKKILESDFPIKDVVRAEDGMYLRQTQLSNPDRFVLQYSLDGQSWITIGDIGAVARDLEKEIADRIAGDNALQVQIDENKSDIATNAAEIADLESEISQSISDLQSQITSNDSDISVLQSSKADRFTIPAQPSFDVLASGMLVFSDETTITGGYTNSNKLTIDITKAIQFNFSDWVEYVSTDAVGAPQRTLVEWADNENGTYTLHLIDGNDVVTNIVTYTESTGAFAWHIASGDITLPISLGWKVCGRINGNWNSAIMAAGHPEVVMNTKDVFNVLRGAVASFADTDNDIYGTIEETTATKIDTIIGGNGVVITGTGTARTINFNQEAMPKFASTESPTGAINSSFTGLLANLTPITGITPEVSAEIIFANGYVGIIQSKTATGYTAVISSTPVAATFSSLGGVYTDNPSLVGGFNTKQDKIPAGTSGNIVTYSGNQGQFGSVSPANLPISTLVQNALNTKFNSSGGVVTGDTTFRTKWTVKASDTATISMSGGVSSQGGTITVVNGASTNVYYFTPTAFWTGNATLGRAGGWSWENVYTKLINNGGDIIVPTTSGTMALISDVTSATSNKADKSTDFVTPITSANKGLTQAQYGVINLGSITQNLTEFYPGNTFGGQVIVAGVNYLVIDNVGGVGEVKALYPSRIPNDINNPDTTKWGTGAYNLRYLPTNEDGTAGIVEITNLATGQVAKGFKLSVYTWAVQNTGAIVGPTDFRWWIDGKVMATGLSRTNYDNGSYILNVNRHVEQRGIISTNGASNYQVTVTFLVPMANNTYSLQTTAQVDTSLFNDSGTATRRVAGIFAAMTARNSKTTTSFVVSQNNSNQSWPEWEIKGQAA